jgi:glutathione peroxidase
MDGLQGSPYLWAMPDTKTLHDLEIGLLNGGTLRFRDLAGRYLLLVNVASACGYTPQYRQLQELQASAPDHLRVVGMPCNDFGAQEPGDPAEIRTFCERNYGVSFLLTEKIRIQGDSAHPVIRWLCTRTLNGVADAEIAWNFTKFVVSPEGRWLGTFPPGVSPLDEPVLDLLALC